VCVWEFGREREKGIEGKYRECVSERVRKRKIEGG
jgi:hypothetical protein